METTNGSDEAGNGLNNIEDVEETFQDAEDGQCLGLSKNGKSDESDALGRGGNPSGESVARMPVHKYASHYNMGHKKRGLALIFNHEHFEVGNLKPRSGTNEDCKNLKECLIALDFDVQVFKDLNYLDIEDNIKRTARTDHSNHDCLLISVLSHGEMGIIYAKDTAYKPDYLWAPFTADRCPTLAGKPKVFFLQACQGDRLDAGVNLSKTETDGEIYNTYRIPVQADFLIVYSTVKGYYSWRNTTKGSWFVQSLVEELKKRAYELDLMTILTFVAQRVALDFESNVPDNMSMHRQKQIPCIMSMLTRLIQFKKKEEIMEESSSGSMNNESYDMEKSGKELLLDTVDGQCLGRSRNNGDSDEKDARPMNGSENASGPIEAKMPTDKYATHYNMEHKKRGLALIFNHETFKPRNYPTKEPPVRRGTNEDCKNLKACLLKLGFDVHVYKDLSYQDIQYHIEKTAKYDHTNHDCLLICVLTHGDFGILHAHDVTYKSESLWNPFTGDLCPTLAGKPKIFFLQACQGNAFDDGVKLVKTETDYVGFREYTIPIQADFLIVVSTVEGYYSLRNTAKGSWFIQALVQQLNEKAFKMDLMTILTFVNQSVALDFESSASQYVPAGKKQVPSITSRLTRLIQFKPKVETALGKSHNGANT